MQVGVGIGADGDGYRATGKLRQQAVWSGQVHRHHTGELHHGRSEGAGAVVCGWAVGILRQGHHALLGRPLHCVHWPIAAIWGGHQRSRGEAAHMLGAGWKSAHGVQVTTNQSGRGCLQSRRCHSPQPLKSKKQSTNGLGLSWTGDFCVAMATAAEMAALLMKE